MPGSRAPNYFQPHFTTPLQRLKWLMSMDPNLKEIAEGGEELAREWHKFSLKGYSILHQVQGILESNSGPSKIWMMLTLYPGIRTDVVKALKKYYTPLDANNKQKLYKFYEGEEGLLPYIVRAVGKEAILEFIKEQEATSLLNSFNR